MDDSDPNRRYRKRVLLWIGCCIVSVVFAPLASIMVGVQFHARDLKYDSDLPKFNGRTILMQLVLIGADPIVGTMTMDWTFIGEVQSGCSSSNLQACSDVNVFFDHNLLLGDGSFETRSNDRPLQPIYRFNSSSFALKDTVANSPTFRTVLALFSTGFHKSSSTYYPFDEYSSEIFMFAQDTRDNSTVGLSIARTGGIAVGFKTKTITRPNVNIPIGMVNIMVILQRGNLVQSFCIVAVVAIWIITLILLLVMLTSVFFGFRQKGEVLVIPIATLFAFTQLRQSMPDAPQGFGDVLDFVGLLPCLALLSLSAAFTLGAFIVSDPTDEEAKTLSWDFLVKVLNSGKNQPVESGKRSRRESASLG